MFINFLIVNLYFRIAKRYNIIDRPNERSSHSKITIRGAGIIFPITFILTYLFSKDLLTYLPLLIGTFVISTVSFLDDVLTLNNKYRLPIHFISVALLLYQVNLFQLEPLYLIPAFILVVGVINSYNFMDGINGIHALYSIVAFSTLYYISDNKIVLLPKLVFVSLIATLLVFTFFNLRKNARCFSGDVGSVSIAFIVSFLIIKLILKTDDFRWILLLSVYGIDSVATILLRIIRKDNIFMAHRSHFYQYLANDRKYSHTLISVIYALTQLVLNIFLLNGSIVVVVVSQLILMFTYTILRLSMEGKYRLLKKY
jgi:UDP-N-acetylmuramyl pentapeptide phosphotransferase/UDP-N-acetylglucosamine-1-phosphate transferase